MPKTVSVDSCAVELSREGVRHCLILFVRCDTLRSLSGRCVERRESWTPYREIWISYRGGSFWLTVVGDTSVTEDLAASFVREVKKAPMRTEFDP